MAPVAGLHFAGLESEAESVLIADAGGTSYDISVARRGRIRWTVETWLGEEFIGHMTGFPSIDVRSIGAGGGSIAWVDGGGLLHVGPRSAGADPGPACYAAGGTEPTVTDACLVLGYIDPEYFLGGAMKLDVGAATRALGEHVGEPLGLTPHEAASAIMRVVTENMVQLIEDVAMTQGVDSRGAVLVGGGGAAGLNACAIGRRLGSKLVVIPEVGPVISTVGALLSDLTNDHVRVHPTTSDRFDFDGVGAVMTDLKNRCQEFLDGPGADSLDNSIELFAQVRYPSEIWELEVPLRGAGVTSHEEVEALRQDFHALHAEHFGTSDPQSPIVFVGWRGRARSRFSGLGRVLEPSLADGPVESATRSAYFPELGSVEVPVWRFETLALNERVSGPAIVESPVTTIVIEPGAQAVRAPSGSLVIHPSTEGASS
jgi:N-methylhydantoinase A